MDKKEILQCLGDLLFGDNFIHEKAAELQATNPEAFRELVNELIEREDFSEETFYEIYEKYEDADRLDSISEYQYLASKSLISNRDEDGCIFDGPEYEEDIFGLGLDDYPTIIDLNNTYYEIDLEDLDEDFDDKELTLDNKNILDLLQAYQSTKDSTCLFAVLELITENPDLINMIPNSHATILGIDSLANGSYWNKSSNHALIELLESIPGAYLTYSSYHDLLIDDMDELASKVRESIDKFIVEEIFDFPTKR